MSPLRRMYDAAYPSRITDVPQWEALALYVGGNTPHVATDDEWRDQIEKSGARWMLPIYTCSHPDSHDPVVDAKTVVAWLKAHGVTKGAAVALDLETAINAHYVRLFDAAIQIAGWKVIAYGSKDTLFRNPRPSAGYWVADYTGQPHLFPGSMATQWSGSGPFKGQYDPNVISNSLVLWEVPVSLTQADKDWIDDRIGLWATRVVQKIGGRLNEAFNNNNPDMDGVLTLEDLLPPKA